MMTTPLKAIALAVAGLAMQSQALAAPTADQLNSIKLYSDVTIAQDSVTGWGPWTEFEPPAAGAAPLNLPPLTSDLYRNLPQVADTQGGLLGFGVFFTVVNNGEPVSDGQGHALTLTGTEVSPASGGRLLPDVLGLQVNALTGTYPSSLTSVQLTRQEDGTYTRESDLGLTKLILVDSPDAPAGSVAPVTFYQFISYITGDDAEGDATVNGLSHTGVIGRTTAVNDIAALRLGNVIATYNGHSLTQLDQGGLAPMTMTVNFGQSSWSGTWNNGVSANGAVGFSAAGTLSGAQFSSTPGSITALDSNNLSGSVRGAFYGAQAAAAAGIADITKNNVRHVDPFIAFKQAPVSVTPVPTPPVGSGTQ